MATDGDRLKAERFFIESAEAPTDLANATHCNIHRTTIKRYREAGEWEIKRAEYWRRATSAATLSAVVSQAVGSILSRLEGLALAASIARNIEAKDADRLAAIKLASTIDAWGGDASDDGGDTVVISPGRPTNG